MNEELYLKLKIAVETNQAESINTLIGDFPLVARKKALILQYKFNLSGMSLLHLTATGTSDGEMSCCYESAEKIRDLVFSSEQPSHWLDLLKHQTTRGKDTVIHFAARQCMARLIRLLASGLTSKDWLSIVVLKNRTEHIALTLVGNAFSKVDENQIKDCIEALIEPLSEQDKEIFLSKIKPDFVDSPKFLQWPEDLKRQLKNRVQIGEIEITQFFNGPEFSNHQKIAHQLAKDGLFATSHEMEKEDDQKSSIRHYL